MHGFELVWFRCGIPAVVVSFLLIDCLDDLFLHAVIRFPDVNSHSCRMLHTNATRTLTFGAKRNGKDACRCAGYADRSCRCLPALEPTLVASMDGRPCTEQPELAGRGSGGTGDRNHRAIKAGKWGRLCHRSSWQRIDWSSEVPSAGSGPSGPLNKRVRLVLSLCRKH